MKTTQLLAASLGGLLLASVAFGQEVINLRPNQVTPGGFYDIGRVRLNYSDVSTSGLGQWNALGTTGLKPTQGIWQSFARFHMSHDSDGDGTVNFSEFQSMGRIYVNVPVLAHERNGLGALGVPVHVILVPEINIPEGSLPNAGNASQWDTKPGNYRVHTFPADVRAAASSGDFPAAGTGVVYSFDVTDVMKRWIDQGFVTASSTFGLGFVPAEPRIVNGIALPQADRVTSIDSTRLSFSSQPLGTALSSGGGSARLVNIATRGTVGSGEGVLIPGFVVKDGNKRVLVRAVGAELGAFGITNPAANPRITVRSGDTVVASNDNWDVTTTNRDAVIAANGAAGAFALTAGSNSAALVFEAMANTPYTVVVENTGASTGVVLAEVYEQP